MKINPRAVGDELVYTLPRTTRRVVIEGFMLLHRKGNRSRVFVKKLVPNAGEWGFEVDMQTGTVTIKPPESFGDVFERYVVVETPPRVQFTRRIQDASS